MTVHMVDLGGRTTREPQMHWSEALNRYQTYLRAAGQRPGTIKIRLSYLQRAAVALPPPQAVTTTELLEWLAGTALDPRTSYPEQFIERVFDNLPCEAITLRSLRRRARGRYHAAAAFAADQSCDLKGARRHILPALKGDLSLIWNRGFDRIAIRALLG